MLKKLNPFAKKSKDKDKEKDKHNKTIGALIKNTVDSANEALPSTLTRRDSVLLPFLPSALPTVGPNPSEPPAAPPRTPTRPKRPAPPPPSAIHNSLNIGPQKPTSANNKHIKLIDDTLNMPTCFESSLIRLFNAIGCQKANQPSQHSFDSELSNCLQFATEEFYEPKSHQDALGTIKSLAEANDWSQAYEKTDDLLKQIQSLNLNRIKRMLPEVQKAAEVITQKSLLLFLGNESCGRSLTIHYLLGSKISPDPIKGNSLLVSNPKFDALNAIKVCRPDEKKPDEDEFMVPISVNLTSLGIDRDAQVVLCDTPCLTNNTDIETDIIEGLSIVKAVCASSIVKPVLVICKEDFESGFGDLKELAHKLLLIMTSLARDLESFAYVYTKFTGDKQVALQEAFKNVECDPKFAEGASETFNRIYADMKAKSQQGALFVDALNNEGSQLLEDLLEGTWIENPTGAFNFSIAPSSSQAIAAQLNHHKSAIFKCVDTGNVALLAHKLAEVRYLVDHVTETFRPVYNECTQRVKQHLIHEFDAFKALFDRPLTTESVQALRDLMQRAKDTDAIRKDFLDSATPSSASYDQYITDACGANVIKIQESEIDDQGFAHLLEQTYNAVVTFLGENDAYTVLDVVAKKRDELVGAFKAALEADDFEQCAALLDKIVATFGSRLLEKASKKVYDDLKKLVVDSAQVKQGSIEGILQSGEANFGQVASNLNSIDAMSSNANLSRHVSKKDIEVFCEKGVEILVKFYDGLAAVAQSALNESQFADMEMQKKMREMRSLMEIAQLEAKRRREFDECTKLACDQIMKRVDTELRKSDSVDYAALFAFVSADFGWIEQQQLADLLERIHEALASHFGSLGDEMRSTKLDWKSATIVDFYNRKFGTMALAAPQCLNAKVQSDFEALVEKYQCELNEAFDAIEAMFGDNNEIDLDAVKKAFEFLQSQSGSDRAGKLGAKGRVLLDSHFESVNADIGKLYEEVKALESTQGLSDIVDKLADNLNVLVEIRTKHAKLFEMLSECNQKLIHKWENELSTYDEKLADELKELLAAGNHEKFTLKLSIANAMSLLDKCGIKGVDFGKCYKETLALVDRQAPEELNRALAAIREHDYETVADVFANFTSLGAGGDLGRVTQSFAQAKTRLRNKIDDLIQEAQNNARFLFGREMIKHEMVNVFNESFKKLVSADRYVKQYLDDEEKLKGVLDGLRKSVAQGFGKVLAKIRRKIEAGNFNAAEDELEVLDDACVAMRDVCAGEVLDDIGKVHEFKEETIAAIKKRYAEGDIESTVDASLSALLENIAELSDDIYVNAVKSIKASVVAKFESAIENVKEMPYDFKRDNRVKALKSALKYLPKDLRMRVEVDLAQLDDCSAVVKLVEDTIATGDLDAISGLMENSRALPHFELYKEKVRDFVRKELRDCKIEVEKSVDGGEVVKRLARAYEIKQALGGFCGDLSKNLDEIRAATAKIWAKNEACVRNWNVAGVEVLLVLDRDAKEDFGKEFLPNFGENFAVLLSEVVAAGEESQAAFDTALAAKNFEAVNVALGTIRKQTEVLEKLKARSKHSVASYGENKTKVLNAIGSLLREILNEKFLNERTKRLKQSCDEYYVDLARKMALIKSSSLLSVHFDQSELDSSSNEASIGRKISEQIALIKSEAGEFTYYDTDSLIDKSKLYNTLYNNLNSITANLSEYRVADAKALIDEMNGKVLSAVSSLKSAAEASANIQAFVEHLISLKIISDEIFSMKGTIEKHIERLLSSYKNNHGGAQVIAQLGLLLDKSPIGKNIVAEYKIFAGYNVAMFNTKVSKHGIDYVMEHLKGDAVENAKDRAKLREKYDIYDKEYKDIVRDNLKPNMQLDSLIKKIIEYIGTDVIKGKDGAWSEAMRTKVPKLLGKIFGLWTLMNATHYFEATGLENQGAYLFSPHPAQVVGILRILGVGDRVEAFENNLVQIGTGEGKSVVLAVTATLLALLGYDVSCVCYSDYLSQRDLAAFSALFNAFSLTKFIHYGTFQKLCESFINRNGPVREIVESLVKSDGSSKVSLNDSNRPKLLLIDEVDVFFSKDFYGNTYSPSATFQHASIEKLTDYLWANKDALPSFNAIKASPEFGECCAALKDYAFLIEGAVKEMMVDIKSYEHDYVVKDDRIGYKEQDTVIFNAVYGYKTMFAYYSENENGNISREKLQENIKIQINCGTFSYAAIAHEYKHIIGVTGTLSTLSEPQKEIVKNEYKICKNTFMPSVFGQNNLKITDLLIENSADYYNVLSREISNRILGATQGTKRAVLVFFETKAELTKFFESSAFSVHKDTAAILTEDAYAHEKESIIKNATVSGQVTLLTRSFGRGTDFIIRDQIVKSNGGMHVIQTFFSDELSEEIQIKGRTARQGELGSYSMVLLDQSLQKFLMTVEEITRKKHDIYDELDAKRNEVFKDQYKTNKDFVDSVKLVHDASLKFLEALWTNDVAAIIRFLKQQNDVIVVPDVGERHTSRTICLMDATGSMGALLQKSKNNVRIMFERALEVLVENKISSTFEMQFACYRDYDSYIEGLLEVSPWETKPDNLRAFMDKIQPNAGGDIPEAIEIGLWHANQEHEKKPISQVILIGDAPAKEEQSVIDYRKKYRGEPYWKNSKYGPPTHYVRELEKLIESKVPVHAFYVNNVAKKNFEEIAKKSGGKCQVLDINSEDGAKLLTDLVTEQILNNIGQLEGNSEALVEAYRKKFGRSYN